MSIASLSERSQIERAATPTAFVHAILDGYAKYGVDPSEALRESQITPAMLADRSACVTASQFERFCRLSMLQLDDEALGWFSRRFPWGTYGLLCRGSLGSPNLGIALKRWCRHHRLLTDEIVLNLSVADDVATLEIAEQGGLGTLREFCLVSGLRYVLGYACWFIDSRIPLIEIDFSFARPAHGSVHTLLFPGPVRYARSRTCIRFSARYLALAPRRDERALQAMLQHALPLTVLQYRRDRLLADRARALMTGRPGAPYTAASLATMLNVSVRTLHRQLEEEGTSLQALKDAIRCEIASAHLARTAQSIKQVALSIGYSSEKTFSRAFRHWTGETPGEYRQRFSSF